MKISVLKFGGTPLWVVDGVVSRGVISVKRSPLSRMAFGVFCVSLTLFFGMLLFMSGRSYVAQARYAFRAHIDAERLPLLSALLAAKQPSVFARLPLSPDRKDDAVLPLERAPEPLTLLIPRLQITAPVLETGLDAEIINNNLERGIVQWPGSATPGDEGSTILLGHSSAPLTYKGSYGSVFALLGKLARGDTVKLEGGNETFTYAVRDRIILAPHSYQSELGAARDGETLVLVSCWPVGTAWQRIAVRADRVF